MDALQQLNLAAPITDTYTRIESMIIMHIAQQIAGNPQGLINNSSEWRIQMLARMGKLTKDTAKIIASNCKGVGYEIETAINTSVQSVLQTHNLSMTDKLSENIRSALTMYDRQAISGKYNQVNTVMQYKSKQAYLNAVNGTVSRFDRIMEKELANKQEHLDILNANAMAVTLGERSRTQAIRETIEEMSDKGIPAFIDASGREWSAEAYVNMDIRNTVKNAANAAQFASIEELGQDVVLVSSHAGARPLCAPYQGKFYSLSGKSGTIRDAHGKEYTFEPWSSTSYGEAAGLLGINCGHSIRGVSDGMFINREKQYDEKENSEEYEKVVKQRELERRIRKQKTTRNALKAAGDTEGVKEYDRKIRESNAKLDAYCKENGLTNRRDRTEVYGYSDPSRKKVRTDFVETLDKSGNSGIIKSGSDVVAQEEQRYGRNKNTLVNKTYIYSGEYKRKFDNATDNPAVNKSLYDCAKKALRHRSGTVFEDMYWIDGTTGEAVAKEITSVKEQEIVYLAQTKKTVASYPQGHLVVIHNHPASMPPSAKDFNSCYRNGYKIGFISCHNGKIFAYTSNQEISETLYDMYIQRAMLDGSNEYNAQMAALSAIKENHDIDFWEVS